MYSPFKWQYSAGAAIRCLSSGAPFVGFQRHIGWPLGCNNPAAMMNRISGELERYMDLLSARQKLVATNIANAETPGYHTQDIDFQAEFQRATGGAPGVIEPAGLAMKNDGNNVSIDRESRLLSENALRFNVAANLLRGQIQMTRLAIKEGQGS